MHVTCSLTALTGLEWAMATGPHRILGGVVLWLKLDAKVQFPGHL